MLSSIRPQRDPDISHNENYENNTQATKSHSNLFLTCNLHTRTHDASDTSASKKVSSEFSPTSHAAAGAAIVAELALQASEEASCESGRCAAVVAAVYAVGLCHLRIDIVGWTAHVERRRRALRCRRCRLFRFRHGGLAETGMLRGGQKTMAFNGECRGRQRMDAGRHAQLNTDVRTARQVSSLSLPVRRMPVCRDSTRSEGCKSKNVSRCV